MDKAVRLTSPGPVQGLSLIDWPALQPGIGEIRIRHEAIGLDYIDIYFRTGLYRLPEPCIPGVAGAGVVEALGSDVMGLHIGQRVVYAGQPGAYAATRILPAWRAVPLPASISAERAGAFVLRALTVHMLVTRVYPVQAGDLLLVHAAAGGLGGMLTRWAVHQGAHVIGTAGSPAKAELAKGNGAEHVIVGRDADLVDEVMRLTQGQGVDFTLDGVGGDMLVKSIAATRRFGTVASVGQVAGPIPPLRVEELGPIRSLSLSRPSVMAYSGERAGYPIAMRAALAMLDQGMAGDPGTVYRLDQVRAAHVDLEAGKIMGAALLRP